MTRAMERELGYRPPKRGWESYKHGRKQLYGELYGEPINVIHQRRLYWHWRAKWLATGNPVYITYMVETMTDEFPDLDIVRTLKD